MDGSKLSEVTNIRSEFIPFFLNYLRDQTSHLLRGCRSTSTTPAKTPTANKLRKLSMLNLKHDRGSAKTSTPLPCANMQSTDSFATPTIPNLSDASLHETNHPNCTDASSAKHKGVASAPRKFSSHRDVGPGSHGDSIAGKSHRSIHFLTPPEPNRKRDKASLSDYLKSPDIDQRSHGNRNSPHGNRGRRVNQMSPSPHSRPRSGGKGKDKKGRFGKDQGDSSPVFNISDSLDFPPVGVTLTNKLHG